MTGIGNADARLAAYAGVGGVEDWVMRRFLRYAGVGAIVTLWTTLLAAIAASGFDVIGRHPLSYLGAQSQSASLFTVGLVVAALMLTAFHHHVRGRYPVSPGFSAAMLAGLVGQVVAAFASIGGSPTVHRIHTTSALVLGVSLPVLLWRFAAAQPVGDWRRITYRWFWLEAAACVVGLFLSSRMVAPVAEILPASAFHAWIIAVTFGPVGSDPERRVGGPAGGRRTVADEGVGTRRARSAIPPIPYRVASGRSNGRERDYVRHAAAAILLRAIGRPFDVRSPSPSSIELSTTAP